MAFLSPRSVSLEDYGPQRHENNTQFGNGENRGPQVGANYGTLNFKPTIVERAERPPLPSASIPFLPDREFVNRGDFLARVERISSEHPYRVALVGLGGVGKSQLAIKHAHRIKEDSSSTWVFWLRASTRAWVEQGFRSISDKVKLADREQPKANIPDLVCKWLSDERNGKWVMVLDSADDSDVFTRKIHGEYGGHSLETFLPQSNNGSIIITTRDHALAERLTGDRDRTIKVGPMTETEALKLLSGKLGSRPDWNSVIATKLVHALDFFPLAISQAAAYIKGTARSSLEKYLDKFEKGEGGRALLLNHEGGNLGGSVASQMLYSQIKEIFL